METPAVPQAHSSEQANPASALVFAQLTPATKEDMNPAPLQTTEPPASPIITKEAHSASYSAVDTVLDRSSPQQVNMKSRNTDTGSSSHAPNASTLSPNYPPIVYPAVVSPGTSQLHELSRINDNMEIDGPPENKDAEDETMEEETEDDASSEVSEGANLKASKTITEKSIVCLIIFIFRVTWRTPLRETLTSRATMPSQPLFRKPLTLACTSKAWALSDCRSANGTQNSL